MIDYERKLRDIRKAEGLTQQSFSDVIGVALSTVKNYESGQKKAGLSMIDRLLQVDNFQKYTLWLMIGKTSESAGQISPALSHSGPEKTE